MSGQNCTRRRFIRDAAAAAIGGASVSLQNVLGGVGNRRRPNVIVIQPDQHRGTIMRCAGDQQVRTPNLDRLAAEGIRFANCISASPVCSPFRGTMQTGLYCYQHEVVANNIQLQNSLTTFAEMFAEAGYATGYIGKWHLDGGWPDSGASGAGKTQVKNLGYVPTENRQGWQEWLGHEKGHQYFTVAKFNAHGQPVRVEGYDWEPAWQTDMALDFVQRHHKAGTPCLYYLAYGPPHLPEECPRKYLDMYPLEKFLLPPDVERDLPKDQRGRLRKDLQAYYAQVTAIDEQIGRLLDGLKRMGADENTIILYTSDHGDVLGSHYDVMGKLRGKGKPLANAIRIPLIVRWPGKIARGQVCDSPVSSIDLTPTILELGGFDVPGYMPGHSMARWCLEGKGYRNDVLYLGLGDGKPLPATAIMRGSRKQTGSGPVKRTSVWRAAWDGRYLYFPGTPGKEAAGWLYDHKSDPYEMANLIDSPEHRDVRKRLAKAMLQIAEATDDPALHILRQHLKDETA